MSAAAERPVRLRLGTKVALLGSLLVIAAWLAAARVWVGEARDELQRRPLLELETAWERLVGAVRERSAAPPVALDQAVHAARTRAADLTRLREGRPARRAPEPPDLRLLVREELEAAVLRTGALAVAWMREPGSEPAWAPRGRPLDLGASAADGACLVRVPGGLLRLARCLERELRPDGGEPVLAGAARLIALDDVPGTWRLLAPDDAAQPLAASAAWPPELGDGLEPGNREGERRVRAGRRSWLLRARALPELPAIGVVAAPVPPALALRGLLRGEAGPRTADWRRWLASTGLVVGLALACLAALAASVNSAFAPVLDAARRLGADQLDVTVPVRRTDEIGALAAVLGDLGVSLRAARRGWEREARLAAWRDVAQGLAHEIKNPLTPIRGTVENLLRWRREDPDRFGDRFESRMATILEEVGQLARLADAFSDFARLPPPELHPTDLAGLIREVADLQLGDVPGVLVEDRLGFDLTGVEVDAGQLRQVVTNLAKNAREALGGRGGTVILEGGREEAHHWFALSDDGPGVDAGVRDHLFDPGWSTRKTEGGSGLGLWLCQRIVLEHGGSIEAGVSPAGGLRVVVRLPSRAR